jgi:thiamine-monophosphate kinase
VTGSLGAAAAGLKLVLQGARLDADGLLDATGVWTPSSATVVTHCLRALLDPNPPLAFSRSLAEQDLAHAAIDISDGLSGDLRELCDASDVSAWVNAEAIPVDPHAASLERARGGDAPALALHGGEDYQLLMAVAPERLEAMRDLAVIWDIPLTVIGEFAPGPPAVLLKTDEILLPLTPLSHDHFLSQPPRPRPDAGEGA